MLTNKSHQGHDGVLTIIAAPLQQPDQVGDRINRLIDHQAAQHALKHTHSECRAASRVGNLQLHLYLHQLGHVVFVGVDERLRRNPQRPHRLIHQEVPESTTRPTTHRSNTDILSRLP